MKFRTLILASLIALLFSACAGPAADMGLEGSPGAGDEGSGSIGDLIGNLGGSIDAAEEDGENNDTGVFSCMDKKNATFTEKGCVCRSGYYMGEGGFCKKFVSIKPVTVELVLVCKDPKAERVDGECVCKKYYAKNPDGKCVLSGKDLQVDQETAAKLREGAPVKFINGKIEVEVPELFVKKVSVTISTWFGRGAGTNSKVFFAMRSGDKDEWAEYDGSDKWTKLDDPNDGNDREKKDVNEYQQILHDPMPFDKITGFTLHHDGTKEKSPWTIQGITVRAFIVDEEGTPVENAIIYHNPMVLKVIDDQEIDFHMNDVAFYTLVSTDSKHHNDKHEGEKVGSGTNDDVFMDIVTQGVRSSDWGSFHEPRMGAYLDSTSNGLELRLDWNEPHETQGYHNKGEGGAFADFVTVDNIDQFKPYAVSLRLGEGTDYWRPDYMHAYIFKPGEFYKNRRGVIDCWFFEEDFKGEIVIENGKSSGAIFPSFEKCSEIKPEKNMWYDNDNKVEIEWP